MINKLLSAAASLALLVLPAHPQNRPADSGKQVKAGAAHRLSGDVTVKVSQGGKSAFSSVQLKGEPVVVVLEFDSGRKATRLAYKISADAAWSDVYLAGGDQKIGPRAVIEDFPSWGRDNDKEVEVIDPKDKTIGATLQFQGKGSLSVLFDVPADLAKSQKKVSIMIKTVEPSVEEHAFVVSL